jgi:transposase
MKKQVGRLAHKNRIAYNCFMRGADVKQAAMFSYISPEQRVPADHPLRKVREITDRLLNELSGLFEQMYSKMGRPSIAPEKLLRALLLQVLYTIRSERMLIEPLDYNLLFRWFVGLNRDDAVWVPTVFTRNRDRLLKAEVARQFFDLVVDEARKLDLMSDEHFTVDGTLREACAGLKSFKRTDERDAAPPDDPGHATVDFHGEKRSNETHPSTADPEALLARKGAGKEAKLSYGGNVLRENRHGLVAEVETMQADGTAEGDAAVVMIASVEGDHRITVGADKGYDPRSFAADARSVNATPQVAQKKNSAMDRRTTRHDGYKISQQKRKRVEEIFGWMKTVGGMRKLRHRGLELVGWMFTFAAAAYNLVRIRNLSTSVAEAKA